MAESDRLTSLLNEYKGNFFEYLLARDIARKLKFEQIFLNSISKEMLEMLTQQESFIRNYFPHLLMELPLLSKKASDLLLKKYIKNVFTHVELIGKINGNSCDDVFSEADIILNSKELTLPVSIKLAKYASFVNTKSAGVRSFLKKYFYDEISQKKFNDYCDFHYEKMAMSMFHEAGLEYIEGFANWSESGQESLPGRLSIELRKYLLEYYNIINEKIYKLLYDIHIKKPEHFHSGMKSLIGHSKDNILQLVCFHRDNGKVFDKIDIRLIRVSDNVQTYTIVKKTNNTEIIFENNIIQLRLKPMNTFTSKAFKINCSIKYGD